MNNQNQPMNQGQPIYQGQPMNQGQPMYQRPPMNYGQPVFQGQPMQHGQNPMYMYAMNPEQEARYREQQRIQYENMMRFREQQTKKKDIGRLFRILLYYYLAMQVPATLYSFMKIMPLAIRYANDMKLYTEKANAITREAMTNGWFYIIGLILGLIILLVYRRKSLFTEDIMGRRKPMKVSVLLLTVIIMLGINTFATLFQYGAETILNLFGLTAHGGIYSIFSSQGMSVIMYLYVILLGPIMEEILFRGVLLHKLEKYGKFLAIAVSSVCFGLFHGNLSQGIFAIGVGFVLGYIAMEYSVKWSIVLHVFNNALSMVLDVLMNRYPKVPVEFISFLVYAVFTLISIVVFLRRKPKIHEYLEVNSTTPQSKALVLKNAWSIVSLCFFIIVILIYSIFTIGVVN